MPELAPLATSIAYVFLALVALLLGKFVKDVMTPYRVDEQLTRADNPALGLTMAGYFLAVFIVFLGACMGDAEMASPSETRVAAAADDGLLDEAAPSEALEASATETATAAAAASDAVPAEAFDLLRVMGVDMLWVLLGILFLNIGRVVVDKLVLHSFSTTKEIITDRNCGTGAVEFGAYVATGLIAAGSLHGDSGAGWQHGVMTAVVFFALGQLALVLFGIVYQAATSYDVHKAIEKDNVAAGVAMGGNLIAVGIVLLAATRGDFVSWSENLSGFGVMLVVGLALISALRRLTDFVLLPGTTLKHEIEKDRNLAAAFLEGSVAVGTAGVVLFMV